MARLEAAVKEFSASWDKLMEGKDKEVAAERKKLEGLQKKLKEVLARPYCCHCALNPEPYPAP